MLTSVYYYSLYKPYIVGNRESGSAVSRREKIADRKQQAAPEPTGQVYILNKSLKNEIVNYAHDVSYSVTNLRASTRQTTADMENFNRDIHRDGLYEAQNGLADDLEEFAENYNTADRFMRNQPHSAELRAYSYEMSDNVYYNRNRLEKLGLSLSDEGRLSFNRDYFNGRSQDALNVAIGENIQIFAGLHRQAGGMLTEPLSGYMNFKGLSYHYNYKMGAMVKDDGFSIIETGLLIDKVV